MVVLVELNIRFVHRTVRKQVNTELECHAPCMSLIVYMYCRGSSNHQERRV